MNAPLTRTLPALLAAAALLFACSSADDAPSVASPGPEASGDAAAPPGASDDGGDAADGSAAGDASDLDAASADGGDAATAPLALVSSAFVQGATIPTKHSCDGGGAHVSFPLAWSGGPLAVKSYALVMRDETYEAKNASPGLHWAIWDVSAQTLALPEGVERVEAPSTPAGAKQGRSTFGGATHGYFFMCPPNGDGAHVYTTTLYALDVATLPAVDPKTASPAELTAALDGHALAKTSLSGTFSR